MKDPYSISSAEKAAFVKTLAKLYKVYTTDLARLTDTDLDVVLTAEYEQGYVGQNTLRRMMRKLIEREHLKRYKMEEKDCILRIPLTYEELTDLKTRVDDVFDVAPYVKKLIDENE